MSNLSDRIVKDQLTNHDSFVKVDQSDKKDVPQPTAFIKHILVQSQDQPIHMETILSIPSMHKQVFNPDRITRYFK